MHPIGFLDPPVRLVVVPIEPADQRGPDVETDPIEVAGKGVGPVTFGGDLGVVIVIRLGPLFSRDFTRERIFTRRLIEVAVYRNGLGHFALLTNSK